MFRDESRLDSRSVSLRWAGRSGLERSSPWGRLGGKPMLGADEVHVWRADLDLRTPEVQDLGRTLSADELERAERFRFQRDRDRFIVGRGLLRAMLGRYLGLQPTQVHFCYGPRGMPSLGMESVGKPLRFNLSHSDRLALYSFAYGREVGIDLESIRTDMEWEQIARAHFSPGEVAALFALPEALRPQLFFSYWTRKEALAKAVGEGLALPLKQLEVSQDRGEGSPPQTVGGNWADPPRWSVRDLDPGPGYAAALAVAGGGWTLKCWEWPDGEGSAPAPAR